MKILELSLQAFGPFTDVILDFSGGREGLHLVHGPNEAGKSSALRAMRQALFGIPMQSPDDFLHSYQKLRVGMRLRDGDGRELAFVRRKGAKNTLLADDGATPLPDSALAKVLGGVTEAEFSRRFALDHDELVAGGRSILEGAGELGQLLFQAGGGLKDLLEVQPGLDRELESLFKPTGTKPRINKALDELKEAKTLVRQGSLPSTEWVEHDAALRLAAGQLEQVEGRLEASRAEKRRLERIADALPVLARRRSAGRSWRPWGPSCCCRRISPSNGTRRPASSSRPARPSRPRCGRSPSSMPRSTPWSSPRTCSPRPRPSSGSATPWPDTRRPAPPCPTSRAGSG